MSCQNRRLADENARDKGAQNRVYADRVGGQRHQSGDYQDRSDDGDLADKPVVGPADHPKHEAAPDGEAENEKDRGADQTLCEGRQINPAMQCEPQDYRHDDPTDRVVDDRGSDDHLADGAAKKADLANYHRNDLYGRDRQGDSEKQCCDQPLLGIGQHRVGQQLAEQNTTEEGHDDPGGRHAKRGGARAADHPQIGLHAGQQEQQQNAELSYGVDHRLLVGARRKQGVLKGGPEGTQGRRAEQDAGDQLAHDWGLANPLHRLAHQPPACEQYDDLQQENHTGGAARCVLGGERQYRNEEKRDGAQQHGHRAIRQSGHGLHRARQRRVAFTAFLPFADSWSALPTITPGYPLRLNGIFGVLTGKRSMSHPGFGSALVIGYHLPAGDDLQSPTRSLERTFQRRITRTGQNRTLLRSRMSGRVPMISF